MAAILKEANQIRSRVRILLLNVITVSACLLMSRSAMEAPKEPFVEWGLAHLEKVQASFQLKSGHYREELGKNDIAFNWGIGVMLTALNAAASHSPKWKSELRAFVKTSRKYWNPAGPVAGFDVWPMPKPADRYYDDNAWMVLGLVEAHDVLKDPTLMKDANRALDFVLSGEDEKLGGGIYWREKVKDSKNTCSNAPTIAACLAVYAISGDVKRLDKAKELYSWTLGRLQDPVDKIFWDAIRIDGRIDKTKWSYNTALMIQSAAMLAKVTGDPIYRIEAESMASASEERWLKEDTMTDEAKFAFLLLESWLHVRSDSRVEGHQAIARWLWKHGKNSQGWFGHRYDRPPSKTHRPTLIDQAAAIRTLLTVPK